MNQDFTTSFFSRPSPQKVFAAINDVRSWWSGDVEGSTNKLGDEFTYRYEDVHYSKQRIAEFIPDKKIVWLVLDGRLNFVADKRKWRVQESCSTSLHEATRPRLRSRTLVSFPRTNVSPRARARGAITSTEVCGA